MHRPARGLAICLRWTGASRGSDPPNVIFIVIDALRADHMGTYGHERDTTPNLDRLARRSFVFDRAYSAAPWTLPSLASYMTSVYPEAHGLRRPPRKPTNSPCRTAS